jgi:hypothetical protein
MGTSMSRYAPPIGTAGFDRVFVNGYKREPAPPPKMMAATDFVFDIADTLVSFCATASERMTRWILLLLLLLLLLVFVFFWEERTLAPAANALVFACVAKADIF